MARGWAAKAALRRSSRAAREGGARRRVRCVVACVVDGGVKFSDPAGSKSGVRSIIVLSLVGVWFVFVVAGMWFGGCGCKRTMERSSALKLDSCGCCRLIRRWRRGD